MNSPVDHLFSSAELSFVLHATEDESRIVSSIENLLSVPSDSWSKSSVKGHFGNEVATLRTSVAGMVERKFEGGILSGLNASDRIGFLDSLNQRIDERGHLYIRLDKQQMCKNLLRLSETDPIRVRLKPLPEIRRQDYAAFYRRVLDSTE